MKDFKQLIEKPRTVALYAHLTIDDYTSVFEVTYSDFDARGMSMPTGERREYQMEGWVRISDPVELEFSSIDNDSILRNAVASLDEEERKLRLELGKKVAAIQERKNQLLSLTYQPDVPDVMA